MKWNEETAIRDTLEVVDPESVFGTSIRPPESYVLTEQDARLVHFCRTYLSVLARDGIYDTDASGNSTDGGHPDIDWFDSSVGKGDRNLAWGILTSFLSETPHLRGYHDGLSSLSGIMEIATDDIENNNTDRRVRSRMDDLMNVLNIMYFG